MGWPRRVAIATSVPTGVLLALAVWLATLAPTPGTLINLGIGLAIAPVAAVLGMIITRRQPNQTVGAYWP